MAKASTDYNPCVRGILYRASPGGPIKIQHAPSHEARSRMVRFMYWGGAFLQDDRDKAEAIELGRLED